MIVASLNFEIFLKHPNMDLLLGYTQARDSNVGSRDSDRTHNVVPNMFTWSQVNHLNDALIWAQMTSMWPRLVRCIMFGLHG